MDKPAAFPTSGLVVPGSAVLATLVVSSIQMVYLTLPESGSCQTDAAKPSASKPTSTKPLQETQKLARQNLMQLAAYWPYTSEPANTELTSINRNKQTQTTSNGSCQSRSRQNRTPPNQKLPKVCHGWVDIKVGGEWAGRY